MPAPKGHPPYNKNGEGGRPLKWTKEKIDQVAAELEEWIDEKDTNIFIGRFAVPRRISEQLISEFERDNKRFREAYAYLKQKQKSILMEASFFKKGSPDAMKWIMAVNHGIRDTETVSNQAVELLARLIKDTQPKPQ